MKRCYQTDSVWLIEKTRTTRVWMAYDHRFYRDSYTVNANSCSYHDWIGQEEIKSAEKYKILRRLGVNKKDCKIIRYKKEE